ncbi:cytochrome d ubiquinol oxidase subunit II [Listeria ivanovii]|uniref:cytochrome d ubiquinol oxidase subunit II n=1 Tax=Listeria ivanovii TaxID=1638 RepID=UPI00098D58EE|nr:cytochrome d ubiquinol oxidase subunit II [Listeria ivanovii]MBK1966328.1 cytochrome d ubiquinol oxidase subunit II [Listeria ivanovii subsp. londoniensis]MBK1983966.1 cytochrome d ubiquinol oxidase subunit II [Listeria ivanovii subsp. londoniensis]MBK1996042.1 cytochrome d ubiquinol oxidase subunit II [Listeria ivanovii subsp. londoniensis]
MSLNELWFLLIAILFIGFFFLEGFDFGVGMSTRFMARNALERRVLVNTIGPFWDANEVWLLTAGGAIFAAFPNWYATMFSGYYIPLVFLLLALIGRGVSFEFRGQKDSALWVKTWDWVIFFGSILPPFLFGVLFASLIQGMPINSDMDMYAGFFDYITVFSVWGGLTITLMCLLHGLLFITLRTEDDIQDRARRMAKRVWFITVPVLLIFVVLAYFNTDMFQVRPVLVPLMIGIVVVMYVLSALFIWKGRDILAFTFGGLGIVFTIGSIFVALFPRVMISSINSAFDLTIENAASGQYSLSVMTIVAVTLLPFVLGYQIWSYYVFRKRVSSKEKMTY